MAQRRRKISVNKMGLQTSQLRICSMLLWLYQTRLKMYLVILLLFLFAFSSNNHFFHVPTLFGVKRKDLLLSYPFITALSHSFCFSKGRD